MWAADHYNIVLIILILWEFPKCVLIVFTSPPQLCLDHPSFPSHPTLCLFFFFFFFSQNKAILCCQNMLGCVAFQWSLAILLQTTLLEKTDPPFLTTGLPIAPQLGVKLHSQLPSAWRDVTRRGLVGLCECSCNFTWAAACCFQLLPCNNPLPLALTLLLTSLLQSPLILRGSGDRFVLFSTEYLVVLYSLCLGHLCTSLYTANRSFFGEGWEMPWSLGTISHQELV